MKQEFDFEKEAKIAGAKKALFQAVENNNPYAIVELYKAYKAQGIKVDLNWKNELGYTPLMWSIIEDKSEAFYFLVNQKSLDLNAQDNRGDDALKIAIYYTELTYAKALLGKNSLNVDSVNKSGQTSTLVLLKGRFSDIDFKREILTLLIKRNADLNIKSNQGVSPLHVAFSSANLLGAAVKLVENGASLLIENSFGLKPLDKLLMRFNKIALHYAKTFDISIEQSEYEISSVFSAIIPFLTNNPTEYITSNAYDLVRKDIKIEELNAKFKSNSELNFEHTELFYALFEGRFKNPETDQILENSNAPVTPEEGLTDSLTPGFFVPNATLENLQTANQSDDKENQFLYASGIELRESLNSVNLNRSDSLTATLVLSSSSLQNDDFVDANYNALTSVDPEKLPTSRTKRK